MRKSLIILVGVVASSALAMPASAIARTCRAPRIPLDNATIKIDAHGGASCSFAAAAASRFYSVDGVPRHLKVRGTRLTYRGSTHRGSRRVTWRYSGRRLGRSSTVLITQIHLTRSSPHPPPASPPATPPIPPSPTPPSPTCQGACLDPYAYDYDCLGGSGDGPLYTGRVLVVGYDHYGLDADGDGIGCDSS